MRRIKEVTFEEAIEGWLLKHGGCERGLRSNYDPVVALDTAELHTFVTFTQREPWERLVKLHGGDPDEAQNRFIDRVARQIDERGTLDVLRHGVTEYGLEFRLMYPRPASGLNLELARLYAANRLTVVRQLAYRSGSNDQLDLVLFVNGIPVVTTELKNQLTGQSVRNGMAQYRFDRDPKDLLLCSRALVHFALDQDEVMMTTELRGKATRFLPFNRGSRPGDQGCGKGNPSNPGGYKTSYLWEKVWQRDSLLDILRRFIHLEAAEPGRRKKADRKKATLIFPRYHQWDAVLKLEAAAKEDGPGTNYLVEHSAGSGKSNTIAWLSHRLASLHDESDAKVFDKIIVISDRKVLDKQLQDTIFQFEHARGMVAKIEQSSKELAEALRSAEAKIIITTLQKFPFIVDEVSSLPERRYAVIIDEAHSSQTGETAQEMKRALAGIKVEEGEDGEIDAGDAILAKIESMTSARRKRDNLSMFAFTATPKGKTLELFGRKGSDGLYHPSHLYAMRQAIEEGFIMDVLANYTTYQSYYRIAKAAEDDPEVSAKRAARAIAKYASLHPTHVGQKAEIIVEHFRQRTRPKIGGRAKAMVVCRSRLHAVRMRLAIDSYLRENGNGDIKALVAFSGTVTDPDIGIDFTEPRMNGFPESQTVGRFDKEYDILVAAEKFQTGFDQPLLHTMFVDKRLFGLNAVQTLSRLNRIHADKEDTFVLDFENDADTIQRAFSFYYEESVGAPTDPNELWDAWTEVETFGILDKAEIEAFALEYFGGDPEDKRLQGRLYALLETARDRFADLDPDDQEDCRTWLKRFVSRYAFLSQIIPFSDTDMEKRYQFCRLLLRRLPSRDVGTIDLGEQLELTHLRVAKTGDHDLRLQKGEGTLISFGEGAPGTYEDPLAPLSEVIERMNEAFGLNLTDADRLHLEGIALNMVAEESVQRQAAANTLQNFGLEFGAEFEKAVARRFDEASELTRRILDDREFAESIEKVMRLRVYEDARVRYQKHCPIGELLARDEDEHLEFKSTLTWDVERKERSRLVESAAIKTVAAFLNSRYGGTLVIGVDDKKTIVGLQHDYKVLHKEGKDDSDRFVLHLTQLAENSVGLAAAANVSAQLHNIDGRDVCRVHMEPSGHPVHAEIYVATKGGVEKRSNFYIRLNNATRSIDDEKEAQRYIVARWSGPEVT